MMRSHAQQPRRHLHQKQNQLTPSNLQPNPHVKSISSGQHTTHTRASTDNLHSHRLESLVLQLQQLVDQQQYEIETLTEESGHFMRVCEEQREVLVGLNLEGMRSEYEEQIGGLVAEREKVQEMLGHVREEQREVHERDEAEIATMRDRNEQLCAQIEEQLERKKSMIGFLANKDKELMELQIDERELQQRLDELRNVQRKLTIALRQLQMSRAKHSSPRYQQADTKPRISSSNQPRGYLQTQPIRLSYNSPEKRSSYKPQPHSNKHSKYKYQFNQQPQY